MQVERREWEVVVRREPADDWPDIPSRTGAMMRPGSVNVAWTWTEADGTRLHPVDVLGAPVVAQAAAGTLRAEFPLPPSTMPQWLRRAVKLAADSVQPHNWRVQLQAVDGGGDHDA